MAFLLIAAGFAVADKVKEKKQRKLDKKASDLRRYSDLQNETQNRTISSSSTSRDGDDSTLSQQQRNQSSPPPPPPYELFDRDSLLPYVVYPSDARNHEQISHTTTQLEEFVDDPDWIHVSHDATSGVSFWTLPLHPSMVEEVQQLEGVGSMCLSSRTDRGEPQTGVSKQESRQFIIKWEAIGNGRWKWRPDCSTAI